LAGELQTVYCPDDNSKVKSLLQSNGTGKVLFIDGQASNKVALLGDILATKAIKNNWLGIIVNGCVRDVEILRELPLCIFALGACPKKSSKEDRGEVGISLKIQGININNGYWVYGDLNGILISKNELSL
jgi:regulator of ribonuclease activity A